MTKPSPAGTKLIKAFLDKEQRGFLVPLTNGQKGMPLPIGDGGALAAANKMMRDGFILLVGARHRRFIILLDKARSYND